MLLHQVRRRLLLSVATGLPPHLGKRPRPTARREFPRETADNPAESLLSSPPPFPLPRAFLSFPGDPSRAVTVVYDPGALHRANAAESDGTAPGRRVKPVLFGTIVTFTYDLAIPLGPAPGCVTTYTYDVSANGRNKHGTPDEDRKA